jgi:hypothetical protein
MLPILADIRLVLVRHEQGLFQPDAVRGACGVHALLDDFANRLRRGRSSRPRVAQAGPAVRDTEPVAAD